MSLPNLREGHLLTGDVPPKKVPTIQLLVGRDVRSQAISKFAVIAIVVVRSFWPGFGEKIHSNRELPI